jgi:hypothetical protein
MRRASIRGGGIYVASRALPERAAMWRSFRDDRGVPIVSTWIDEAGQGETADFSELWMRVVREIELCSALVLYAEPDDFPLKGALVEAGIALGLMKHVSICLPGVILSPRNSRPIGSWIAHPNVVRNDDIAACMRTMRS